MKCEYCIALRNDSGYEHSATEFWCAVGEEEIEFADGSIGCMRRSIQKLKRDIEIQDKIEQEAFAEECGNFIDWINSLKT
jgi:hypothetical protein